MSSTNSTEEVIVSSSILASSSSIQLSSSFIPTSASPLPPPSSSAVVVVSSAFVPQPTVLPPTASSVVLITSVITESPASTGGTGLPSIVVITSTAQPNSEPSTQLTLSSSFIRSAVSSGAPPLVTNDVEKTASSTGLSQGGKIAVAVVVPIVVIALLVVGLLFFWKKRQARKSAEEQRRKEMEEYVLNPNNDPSLPPVGAAYVDNKSEEAEDGVGYRGWGTTNSAATRKPSTNLGSGATGPIGMAVSDGGGSGGGYGYQTSPNGTERPSDGHSSEPLVAIPGARTTSGDSNLAALGAGPAAGVAGQEDGIHRGVSNASSAYSNGPARSEGSDDIPLPGGAPAGPHYHEDSPYYNDQGQPGLYGDNSLGAGQPVIRDVQAKRNTRIEKPAVFPQQGNSGIAQNF